MTSEKTRLIGLIAGSGQFPLLFAQGAKAAGYEVVAVGFDGETDPELARHVATYHVVKLGQLNRMIKIFQKAGVRRAAMAGAINKTRLYAKIRPDWRAFKLLRKLSSKKDDLLLRSLAQELEKDGIIIEPSTLFLPGLLAPEGVLTRRKPNSREKKDIDFGWEIAKAVGHLDIGQCLVLKDQAVLAVEGIDGTDATIRRGGSLCRRGAVVIKVSKPHQDLRFDVPAVGIQTIRTMHEVKASALVIEAGRTLMFDRNAMIAEANRYGITIVARPDPSGQRIHSSFPSDPWDSTQKEKPAPSVFIAEPVPHAVRVAVIGVGYLGRFHAHKYAESPHAELVAVVDVDEARAREIARETSTSHLQDHRGVLDMVDAVSIVTPTPAHYSIARDFLDRGIHVLLEKPMTETTPQAEELVSLSHVNRCILQVGHLERFNPAFQAIRTHIRSPLFLETHRLALFNERGLEVDVILDLMIHDLDIALHLIDSPLASISASGVPVLTHLPDIANVRLEFQNGAVANLTASRISMKNLRRLRIFQERSYLVADYGKHRAFRFQLEQERGEDGYPEISVQELPVKEHDALEEEIEDFLRCIRRRQRPVVDGRQGMRALAVALDISRQIRRRIEGRWTWNIQETK